MFVGSKCSIWKIQDKLFCALQHKCCYLGFKLYNILKFHITVSACWSSRGFDAAQYKKLFSKDGFSWLLQYLKFRLILLSPSKKVNSVCMILVFPRWEFSSSSLNFPHTYNKIWVNIALEYFYVWWRKRHKSKLFMQTEKFTYRYFIPGSQESVNLCWLWKESKRYVQDCFWFLCGLISGLLFIYSKKKRPDNVQNILVKSTIYNTKTPSPQLLICSESPGMVKMDLWNCQTFRKGRQSLCWRDTSYYTQNLFNFDIIILYPLLYAWDVPRHYYVAKLLCYTISYFPDVPWHHYVAKLMHYTISIFSWAKW